MLAAAQPRGKSPEAFRTISEVSEELDVPQHVLRFWESRFAQIRPVKRAGGRRYYRPEDIDLLRGIRSLLYSDGYTIRGVQKILRDRGLRQVAEIGRGEVEADAPAILEVEIDASAETLDEVALEETGDEQVVAQAPAGEPTHARAAIAMLERAHAAPSVQSTLSPEQQAKLEFLLADLLNLKKRLNSAK